MSFPNPIRSVQCIIIDIKSLVFLKQCFKYGNTSGYSITKKTRSIKFIFIIFYYVLILLLFFR